MDAIKEWERYEKSPRHASLDVRYSLAVTKDTVVWGHIDFYDRGGFTESTYQEVIRNPQVKDWIEMKFGRDVWNELLRIIGNKRI